MGHALITGPVLVTGATGYLGRRVVHELMRRKVSFTGTAFSKHGDMLCGDMTSPDITKRFLSATGAAVVIHCAARVPQNYQDYVDEWAAEDNLRMVNNLLAAFPSHVVFPSSMTVYGNDLRRPVGEDDVAHDLKGYARTKRAAEIALLETPRSKATVLRLPGLFGPPRRSGFVYNTALALAEHRQPTFPEQPPSWSTMHVDDAAELCVRAALRYPDRSVVLNAGYSGTISLCSVMSQLTAIFGAKMQDCQAPEFEMDLTQLVRRLGMPSGNLKSRLCEVASWTRQLVDPIAATKSSSD